MSNSVTCVCSKGRTAVRIWLWFVAATILITVLVGGVTRLMGAGLSITTWEPLTGFIPPLSSEEWERVFQAYKKILQYEVLNYGMTLDEFKFIFWLEWWHRFLGRCIGVMFLIPFLVFTVVGFIPWKELPSYLLLLLCGAVQGLIGWWMVVSGLEQTAVEPYRLSVHMLIAMIIFSSVIWKAERLVVVRKKIVGSVIGSWLPFTCDTLIVCIFVQIFLGTMVAGNNAGLIYNTWPLMGEAFYPIDELSSIPLQTGWFAYLFGNEALLQFAHRLVAYMFIGLAFVYSCMLVSYRSLVGAKFLVTGFLFFGLVILQFVVGVFLLLLMVPFLLALAHQLLAVVILGSAIVHRVQLAGP